ncbi:MAG: glycosyltransferase family protein [Nanoarchaeota archaeon]
MARIWYTVCSEGFGHATRSEAVIKKLLKNHDVTITAYGKAI